MCKELVSESTCLISTKLTQIVDIILHLCEDMQYLLLLGQALIL